MGSDTGRGTMGVSTPFAQVHDLGLALTPIGLGAGALGLMVGTARILRARLGLAPSLFVSAMLLAGLAFLIAKMVGA